MRFVRTLAAELLKCLTLPGVWAGLGVMIVGSTALTLLNAVIARQALVAGQPERLASSSPFETAFAAMPLGTVGAVVIGVLVVSSEYAPTSVEAGGSRQITTTLTATPARVGMLVGKALTVVVLVVAGALVSLSSTTLLAHALLGDLGSESVTAADALARCLGGTLYWTLTGLIALAITAMVRSGVVPLIVLTMNNSLVSFSLLLTNLTPLAHWLPDMAGRRLFAGLQTVEGGLDAAPGALVMAAWTALLLSIAAVVVSRRDA